MRLLIIFLIFLVGCGDIVIPEDKIPDSEEIAPDDSSDEDDQEDQDDTEVGEEADPEAENISSDECDGSSAKVVYKDKDRTIYACSGSSSSETEDPLRKWCHYKAQKRTQGALELTYLPSGGEQVRILPTYILFDVNLDVRAMLVDASGEEVCRVLRWDGEILDVYQLYNRINFSVKIRN